MSDRKSVFDHVLDRRGTNCGKWDTMDQKYQKAEMIHLGVADMDFQSPKAILDAFEKLVEHGVFGYTDLNEKFYTSIQSWMQRRHHIKPPKDWIVFCPRINIAAGLCVESLTEKDAQVIINTPAYGPLYQAIAKNFRTVLESPLVIEEGTYRIDFENLEKIVTEKTKMFVLCSPHNPVGRAWTKQELEKVGDFCKKHNLILFVDEIHGDITAENATFTSMCSLSETVTERLVLATSLTKTFNVPGVIIAYMIIPNPQIREKIRMAIDRVGMHNPTIFAVAAVTTGYTECDQWYEEMLTYINENERFTRQYFETHFPELKIMKREATYLLWIDYKDLGCTEEELEEWFINQVNVSVYMGTVFGEAGRGFIRMNLASPREVLREAFERMKVVYCKIKLKMERETTGDDFCETK